MAKGKKNLGPGTSDDINGESASEEGESVVSIAPAADSAGGDAEEAKDAAVEECAVPEETGVEGETPVPEKPSPVVSLFAAELERLEAAIGDFDDGKRNNMAVIAPPFAGRMLLMKELQTRYEDRCAFLSLFSVVTQRDFLSDLYGSQDIIILDKCHFLALRKIGGFSMLDEFLRVMATSGKLFITSWNTYMWAYLRGVRNIDRFFPVIVTIPKLEPEPLKRYIFSKYDRPIEFIDDQKWENPILLKGVKKRLHLPFSQSSVEIPWVSLNRSRLSGSAKKESLAAEDIICNRICRIANGNLGVAEHIFEEALDFPQVRTSLIPTEPCAVDFDINEAYLLGIILSMESLKTTDIEEIARPEIDVENVMYRLLNSGMVALENEYYVIRPEALNCVVDTLTKRRMVW